MCRPSPLIINLSMQKKKNHTAKVYVWMSYVMAHYWKNSVHPAPTQGKNHPSSRSLFVTLIEFLWSMRDLFLWGDLIIQQLLLYVCHRSDSARSQRYSQRDMVLALENIQSDGGADTPGYCISASGALKGFRSREARLTWLWRVEDGLEKKMTLELSPERPAVWCLQSSANSILLKFHCFLCYVLLFSPITQLPMIIKWNLPDGCFRKTMACLLALFVKAGIGSKLSRMPLPWDCLWIVALLCILAEWPAHQQGQVEWQVGVPCMQTLWSLPSHLPARRWGAERLFYKDVIYQLISFLRGNKLLIRQSFPLTTYIFPVSCNIINVKFPMHRVKTHTLPCSLEAVFRYWREYLEWQIQLT